MPISWICRTSISVGLSSAVPITLIGSAGIRKKTSVTELFIVSNCLLLSIPLIVTVEPKLYSFWLAFENQN